jgi:hypothetical protein
MRTEKEKSTHKVNSFQDFFSYEVKLKIERKKGLQLCDLLYFLSLVLCQIQMRRCQMAYVCWQAGPRRKMTEFCRALFQEFLIFFITEQMGLFP